MPSTDEYRGYHQFTSDTGETFGSFEVWWKEHTDEQGEFGWYWWSCFPGCIPDSEAIGPFNDSQEAFEDAICR